MKKTHVVIHYAPWKGTHQVSAEDAEALICVGFEINGHRVGDKVATLEFGTFASIRLEMPPSYYEIDDEMNEKNRAFHQQQIAEVRDELTEEDWLMDTTDDVLVLPVASLEMVERVDNRVFA